MVSKRPSSGVHSRWRVCVTTEVYVYTVCQKALDLQALHLYNAPNGPIYVGFHELAPVPPKPDQAKKKGVDGGNRTRFLPVGTNIAH